MTIFERMKAVVDRSAPKAEINELPDRIRLTVSGRKNQRVTIRLLDESIRSLSFFDDNYVSSLEFRIRNDQEPLVVDFDKPSQQEQYKFEVTTRAGTTFLEYCAA